MRATLTMQHVLVKGTQTFDVTITGQPYFDRDGVLRVHVHQDGSPSFSVPLASLRVPILDTADDTEFNVLKFHTERE